METQSTQPSAYANLEAEYAEAERKAAAFLADPRYQAAVKAQQEDLLADLPEEHERVLRKYSEVRNRLLDLEDRLAQRSQPQSGRLPLRPTTAGVKRGASIMGNAFSNCTWGADDGKVNKSLKATAENLGEVAGGLEDIKDAAAAAKESGDFSKLEAAIADGEKILVSQGQALLVAHTDGWQVSNAMQGKGVGGALNDLLQDDEAAKRLKRARKEVQASGGTSRTPKAASSQRKGGREYRAHHHHNMQMHTPMMPQAVFAHGATPVTGGGRQGGGSGFGQAQGVCFNCNKPGHYAKNCPMPHQKKM